MEHFRRTVAIHQVRLGKKPALSKNICPDANERLWQKLRKSNNHWHYYTASQYFTMMYTIVYISKWPGYFFFLGNRRCRERI
jgi:hypothetical protein